MDYFDINLDLLKHKSNICIHDLVVELTIFKDEFNGKLEIKIDTEFVFITYSLSDRTFFKGNIKNIRSNYKKLSDIISIYKQK